MGITLLTVFLFGAGTFLLGVRSHAKKLNKRTKWAVGLVIVPISAILGMFVGGGFSFDMGKEIEKKYLVNQAPITILKNIDLIPFSNSNRVYIIKGKNQYGKKVIWYLREGGGELFEEPYNDTIDRDMIVFTNATTPAKQLVKVNVGSFWEWFAFVPKKYRFVIPTDGIREGKVLKTYKYTPVPK